VIVGQGNVALDVARILLSPVEMLKVILFFVLFPVSQMTGLHKIYYKSLSV